MSTPTMKLTVEVHPDLHAQLKEHCARTRVSMKDFLTEAVIARLRMQGQVVPLHQAQEAQEAIDVRQISLPIAHAALDGASPVR